MPLFGWIRSLSTNSRLQAAASFVLLGCLPVRYPVLIYGYSVYLSCIALGLYVKVIDRDDIVKSSS